jgi:hypothetical protein
MSAGAAEIIREINILRCDPAKYADMLEHERKPYFKGL